MTFFEDAATAISTVARSVWSSITSIAASPTTGRAFGTRRGAPRRALESDDDDVDAAFVRCEKKARVATKYEERLERKLPGENCDVIAQNIASEEGIGARTVQRWAAEVRDRGHARRKRGSGRPKVYGDEIVNEIVEINKMYQGHAASRDVADVLRAKFGVGSKSSASSALDRNARRSIPNHIFTFRCESNLQQRVHFQAAPYELEAAADGRRHGGAFGLVL